jgi:Flp pilus assembly protein protease CpaA
MLVGICVLANLGLALATVLVAVAGTRDARRRRVVIAIAGASLVAFIATQCVMPAGMDIRVDLLLTVPATVVAMGFGARALRRPRQEP